MDLGSGTSTRAAWIGPHLASARVARGLSQAELAARCGLSQAQISYLELDRRRPTLDQLVSLARALGVSLHRLVEGADRPGDSLRDMAVELRALGVVDLWVDSAIVPGAFRRAEEVVARAISGHEPAPRVVEAIPAVLAWNPLDAGLLRAHGREGGPRATRRLAWLADVALAVGRRGGFPGGCHEDQLADVVRGEPLPDPRSDPWDDLGRPMAGAPKSPVWKRWRISYDADLERFRQRARELDQLREAEGEPRPPRQLPGRRGNLWRGSG